MENKRDYLKYLGFSNGGQTPAFGNEKTESEIISDLKQENESWKNVCNKLLKEHNTLTQRLAAAEAYIKACPCDPDITPDQFAAWQKYRKLSPE